MTLDEQIIVVGKLRSLEVILLERILHQDKWHPHHAILAAVTEPANDELLDAKEASRRMGYSTRWLYNSADSLPFTIRLRDAIAASGSGLPPVRNVSPEPTRSAH